MLFFLRMCGIGEFLSAAYSLLSPGFLFLVLLYQESLPEQWAHKQSALNILPAHVANSVLAFSVGLGEVVLIYLLIYMLLLKHKYVYI